MKRVKVRLKPDGEQVYIKLDAWRKWYYNVYLKSEHWNIIRLATLTFFENICPLCGRRSIQVHHYSRGYNFLWDEKPGRDTIAICGKCHQKIHGLLPKEVEEKNIKNLNSIINDFESVGYDKDVKKRKISNGNSLHMGINISVDKKKVRKVKNI